MVFIDYQNTHLGAHARFLPPGTPTAAGHVNPRHLADLLVAAIGENSGLGHVMGPEHEKDKPTAVSNPIFVDVDGNGFTANKDMLGAPLPVKAPGSK